MENRIKECQLDLFVSSATNDAPALSRARVQMVFEAVACHRLDDHPRAVRL